MDFAGVSADVMTDIIVPSLASKKKFGVQGSREEMEKAAKDFESVFMAQMLKPMWEGMETDPVFGGGPGEDVMRDLLVQEYGKSMTAADEFGLSQAVMEEMIKMQEKAAL